MSLIDDISGFSHAARRPTRLMPRGTHHVLTGVLGFGRDCFELHVDGGGHWVIDPPSWGKAHRSVGQLVIVRGVRVGFNLLDATSLSLADGSEKSHRRWF